MNKSFFTFIFLITLLSSSTNFVFAEDETRSNSTYPINGDEIKRPTAARKEVFQESIDARREAIKTLEERRKALLNERLTKFTDQRKATVAKRISENLNTINKNRVDAMTKQLGTIEAILARVKTKTAESTITEAETAIATAKTSVTTQAGKDYTITATDEAKMKEELKAKRDLLFNDLKSVHEKVKLAREKTRSAIKSANDIQ